MIEHLFSHISQSTLRYIVFIKLNGFYLSLIGQDDSGCSAVIRDGVVLESSDTARAWGVVLGISRGLALRRCLKITLFDFRPDDYQVRFQEVWGVLAGITPLVEPTDFHEGFVDLTGCLRGRQSLRDLMQDLSWRFHLEFGIEVQWGGGQDRWKSDDGEILSSTIITTEPNELMATVHSRMPVILQPDCIAAWLSPDTHDVGDLMSSLIPYPDQDMEMYRVSTMVNKPGVDRQECIEPLRVI